LRAERENAVRKTSPTRECLRRAASAVLLVPCLACGGRIEERFAAEGLGEPQFADREVSAVFALPPPAEKIWRMELSSLQGAGIRVEAALGFDADADGVLDDGEVSAIFGTDRNEFCVTGGDGLEERWTAAPSPAGGPLALEIRIAAGGGVRNAAFRDGGGALSFAGLPAAPAWLDPSAWNAVRLTARGAGDRGERLACAIFADGSTLILK
jgi:hypothetical protein